MELSSVSAGGRVGVGRAEIVLHPVTEQQFVTEDLFVSGEYGLARNEAHPQAGAGLASSGPRAEAGWTPFLYRHDRAKAYFAMPSKLGFLDLWSKDPWVEFADEKP